MPEKTTIKGSTALLLLLAMIWNVAFEGFALAKMWGWFVVPLGAPVIRGAHAYGLAVLLLLATMRFRIEPADTDEVALKRVGWFIFTPPLCLLAGWICHWLMA